MQYVTMPPLSTDERNDYITALRAGDTSALYNIAAWLYSGTVKTVTRKGNANDMIRKFTGDKHARDFLQDVHNNDGTQVACNGYSAAVILPQDVEPWALSNAYINTGNGDKSNMVIDCLVAARAGTCVDINKSLFADLLAVCTGHKSDCKRGIVSKSTPVYIAASTLSAITCTEAAALFASGDDIPLALDVNLLETLCKFALCATSDTITVYYSAWNKPICIHANNLYALLLPIRPDYSKQ